VSGYQEDWELLESVDARLQPRPEEVQFVKTASLNSP
jgi:hypothetical protein